MGARWACLLAASLLLPGGLVRADGARTTVIVVVPPGIDAAGLAAARRDLGGRHRLLQDPAIRAVLEGARAAGTEERVREALVRIQERLRRFDLAETRAALADAWAASATLPPDGEGPSLVAQVALREVELALAAGDAEAQRRAMALALSAVPSLALDPESYPPPMVKLAGETRALRAAAPTAELAVDSFPPGASITIEGRGRGRTPLTIPGLARGPQIVWATLPGYQPRVERVDVESGRRLSLTLAPEPAEGRLHRLVERVRRSSGAERGAAARELAEALGVDAVATVAVGAPATLYAREAAAPPQSSDGHRPAAARGRSRLIPLVLGAAGAAAAAAGAYVLVDVARDFDHFEATCAPSCPVGEVDDLETRAHVGYVLVGLGLTAVAGGALWAFWPGSSGGVVGAWMTPAGGGLSAGGTF